MLSPWSVLPEDFSLEDYLVRYGDAVEARPSDYAGRWAQACFPACGADAGADTGAGYGEVRLDLGCGKGAFTVRSALQEPGVLFVGMDVDPVCVAFGARLACESGASNVVFVPGRDGCLSRYFASGELSTIYLNFPTPHPKGRDANARLTHAKRLEEYRYLLSEGGKLCLQTDNQPFFDYTLGQLRVAGYEVLVMSRDAREELPPTPETGYERRAVEMGARIYAIHATPGAGATVDVGGATLPTSLYDYLSEDLESFSYVPPEMARGISAIRRNRATKRTR